MNSKLYDVLKYIQRIFLPALITLYGVIGATCGLPYTEQVLTIAGAVDVFLGAILQADSNKYFKEEQ